MALFGNDTSFYDLLEKQAESAHKAAQEFGVLAGDFGNAKAHADRLKQIETDADNLTHEMANKADAKFVTPLDKDDLHTLSNALDNITDLIEAAAARIVLYQITEPRPDFAPLINLLIQTTEATHTAVGLLRRLHDYKPNDPNNAFVRVHQLENESDVAYRQALGDLFRGPNPDPLTIIKWKEIYDRVEVAIDQCENVADLLERVAIKYA